MKLLQIFSKTPNHKKFSYTPRFYNPLEEERKERELRIQQELREKDEILNNGVPETPAYRQRISGSFRHSKKTVAGASDPSAAMLRLVILLVLVAGLIAFIQFGNIALYVLGAVFVPFYFYLKFRPFLRK